MGKFKRFWTAEEVPRWFGLSLVLVYLVGLGSVGYLTVCQVREESAVEYFNTQRYAAHSLATQLATIASQYDNPASVQASGEYQRILRKFASNVHTHSLRIVGDSRRVYASIIADEIGQLCRRVPGTAAAANITNPGHIFELPANDERGAAHYFQTKIAQRVTPHEPKTSPATDNNDSHPSTDTKDPNDSKTTTATTQIVEAIYLEAVLPAEPLRTTAFVDYAGALSIALVVIGVLFVLYRGLRTQLRSVSAIADRLQSPIDAIKGDLAALRMADTQDAVATAWNQLVELAADLQEEVNRAQANRELSAALAGSSGTVLAKALNAMPDGLLHFAHEGRLEYINAPACRLIGCSEDEAKSTTLGTLKSNDLGKRILEVIQKALRTDGTFEAYNEIIETADVDNAYRTWVIPLQGGRQEGEAIVLVRDVSQALRADRSREDFVAQVTHELRTPLTNIRAYAETLSSGMFDDPKMVTDCYNVITKETRRLSRLVDDILSVSQMEVGSIELELGDVDLKQLFSDTVTDLRGLADEKNIDLQIQPPSKAGRIKGDRDKLSVVLINVIGNAIKYTPEGGHVIVGCQVAEDEITLTVKDNGLGIDSADHVRIFEKFQRAEDPDVQNETGSGIGLYTAREIVRRPGGDIDLMSEKGQGSTFLVRLPYEESRADAMSVSREA